MKLTITLIMLFFSHTVFAAQPIVCGKEWINIHKGSPELVGVYVKQYPDNLADREVYEGTHPAAVYYLFSNHMMHFVTYTPSGQVEDGGWYSAEDSEWLYKNVTQEFKADVFCSFWVK